MRVLQILVLILIATTFTNAQQAILSGTIYDFTGAQVSKGKIKAIDNKGNVFTTYTNQSGQYNLEIPVGAYQIEVEASPLNKFIVSNYWLTYKMQLDVALQCKNDCYLMDDLITPGKTLIKISKKKAKIKKRNKNN